jgi:hypothetical protein
VGEPMDRSKRIFSKEGRFQEIFPTLEDAWLEFTEFEYGAQKRKGKFNIRENGGLMRCSNSRCYRGGYELDDEIHKMLAEGKAEKEIDISCAGDEGTPRGRTIGRHCAFSIEGTIFLRFKNAVNPPC